MAQVFQKSWKELSDKQKGKYDSKQAFASAKKDYNQQQQELNRTKKNDGYTSTTQTRMAGDKMRGLKEKQRAAEEAGQAGRVDKLQNKINRQENKVYGDGTGGIGANYDASAAGKGGAKGKARTSGKDLKELQERYGTQAVVKYMEGKGADTLGGQKAQNLLKKYKTELTNSNVDPDQEDPATTEEGTVETGDTTEETTTDETTPEETTSGGNDEETTNDGTDGTGTNDDETEQTEDTLTGGGIDVDQSNTNSPGGVNNVGDGDVVGGGQTQSGTDNNQQIGSGLSNQENDQSQENVGNSEGGSFEGDINGNNNVVDNRNQSRYYEGSRDNFQINYGEGSNPGNTALLSDLTTLGYGDADDSPASQAAYVDFYQTLNKDAQDAYKTSGSSISDKWKDSAKSNSIDHMAMRDAINESIQNHYDLATKQQTLYQGDPYNYVPKEYQMPTPLEPIENNVEDLKDDAEENLD